MAEAPMQTWLMEPLPAGVAQRLERLRHAPGVARVAVMPDVHVAGDFCVGTVVATRETLFPVAVGGDIGCGMLALRFDAPAERLADAEAAARVLGLLYELSPTRRHHRKLAPALPETLREVPLDDAARLEFSTLGGGNHFLELQRDGADALWLMLHTGSRHFGQMVFERHLPKARKVDGFHVFDAASGEGQAYLREVQTARLYARENRLAIARAVMRVLKMAIGASPVEGSLIDCDHNHLAVEEHDGAMLFVHRKGATTAHAGQMGVIPGSMGTKSFHTRGRGLVAALCSSSHGAGRALTRTQAREAVTKSALRRQLRGVWYDSRIEMQLIEEAPAAYKSIDRVMTAQAELVAIERELRPVLVYKGV